MNAKEQVTFERALKMWGSDAARAWENTCAQARRERKRIPSETIELQTVVEVDGKYAETTIATMSHDEYNRLIEECEERHDFDGRNQMPWAIIDEIKYELPIVDTWDTHVTVEKVE